MALSVGKYFKDVVQIEYLIKISRVVPIKDWRRVSRESIMVERKNGKSGH